MSDILDETVMCTVFFNDEEKVVPTSDCTLDPVSQIWDLKPNLLFNYFPEASIPITHGSRTALVPLVKCSFVDGEWKIDNWHLETYFPTIVTPEEPKVEPSKSFDAMTVKELKTAAMLLADAKGHRKSWIQTCSKDQLLEYMQTEKVPESGGLAQVLKPVPQTTVPIQPVVNGDLASLLAAAIAPFLGNLTQKVDESDVIRIVEERLEGFRTPKLIQVQDLQGRKSSPDVQHRLFEKVLLYCSQRKNVYLVGPAGSGKTQMAENIAKHLGLEFSSIGVCNQTPVSAFFGYMDAMGNYVATEFRRRYENGGIFLLDEFDNGNSNTAAALNQATSNGQCAFPDRMVTKHKDFICICAGNTFGTGADRQYVGRNQLDAATLNRFAFVEFPYDEDLEIAMAPNGAWTRHVQEIRHAVAELKIRHVVSMRASFDGGHMLAAGLPWPEAEEEYIWQGLPRTDVAKIVAKIAKGDSI